MPRQRKSSGGKKARGDQLTNRVSRVRRTQVADNLSQLSQNMIRNNTSVEPMSNDDNCSYDPTSSAANSHPIPTITTSPPAVMPYASHSQWSGICPPQIGQMSCNAPTFQISTGPQYGPQVTHTTTSGAYQMLDYSGAPNNTYTSTVPAAYPPQIYPGSSLVTYENTMYQGVTVPAYGNPPPTVCPASDSSQLAGNIQVWIIGSSIIRDAFYHTQNMNFQLPGVDIFWEFRPGMRICHLQDMIFDLLGKHIPPNYLVVHCGGNDIGQSPLNITELLAIQTIQEIQSVDANIKIIWSQILPRLVWRNEINHTKLNKARRRFNTTLSKYCIQTGGAYIRYPQISENRKYLYRDNVHISEAGNDIFISNLKHGLNAIIYGAATCFPEN